MSTSQDISELINATCQQIWTDTVNNKDFELLQQKAAALSAQLAVHRALHTTLTLLNRQQKLSELRIEKSLKAFFEKSNSIY
jgi:3-keto-L-gulonate-6-phosphate decarboxylase